MKIVLKRRKHRNGVRPARKGSIKIRMVKMPTTLEHCESVCNKLAIHNLTDWKDEFPGRNASQSEWNNYHRNFERRKQSLAAISKMQMAYCYFMEFTQTETKPLTKNLIVGESLDALEEDIDHLSRCKSCEHKTDCPYTDLEGFDKVQRCPFLRYDFGTYALNKSKAKDSLNRADLAEQALTHLS